MQRSQFSAVLLQPFSYNGQFRGTRHIVAKLLWCNAIKNVQRAQRLIGGPNVSSIDHRTQVIEAWALENVGILPENFNEIWMIPDAEHASYSYTPQIDQIVIGRHCSIGHKYEYVIHIHILHCLPIRSRNISHANAICFSIAFNITLPCYQYFMNTRLSLPLLLQIARLTAKTVSTDFDSLHLRIWRALNINNTPAPGVQTVYMLHQACIKWHVNTPHDCGNQCALSLLDAEVCWPIMSTSGMIDDPAVVAQPMRKQRSLRHNRTIAHCIDPISIVQEERERDRHSATSLRWKTGWFCCSRLQFGRHLIGNSGAHGPKRY